MRLALLLALSLATGALAVAAVPTATACTSDPDAICHVIWTLDECGDEANPKQPTSVVKHCVP